MASQCHIPPCTAAEVGVLLGPDCFQFPSPSAVSFLWPWFRLLPPLLQPQGLRSTELQESPAQHAPLPSHGCWAGSPPDAPQLWDSPHGAGSPRSGDLSAQPLPHTAPGYHVQGAHVDPPPTQWPSSCLPAPGLRADFLSSRQPSFSPFGPAWTPKGHWLVWSLS